MKTSVQEGEMWTKIKGSPIFPARNWVFGTVQCNMHDGLSAKTTLQMHVALRIVWSVVNLVERMKRQRMKIATDWLNAFEYTGLNAQKL